MTEMNPYARDIITTLEWLGYNVERADSMEYPNGNLTVSAIVPGVYIHIEDVLDALRANLPAYPNINTIDISGHQTPVGVTILAYYTFWY